MKIILAGFLLIAVSATGENRYPHEGVFQELSAIEKYRHYDTLPELEQKMYHPYFQEVFDSLNQRALEEEDSSIIKAHLRFRANYFFLEQVYHKSIPLYIKILRVFDNLTLQDSLKVYSRLKDAYIKIQALEKAIRTQEKYNELQARSGNDNPWQNYTNMSSLYYSMGSYQRAVDWLKHEIDGYLKNEQVDSVFLMNCYNNLGFYYYKNDRMDSALAYYRLILPYLNKKLKKDPEDVYNQSFLALVNGNIAQVYKVRGQCSEAIPLLKKDRHWSEVVNNTGNVVISMHELADCYIQQHKPGVAEVYLDSAKDILGTLNLAKELLRNHYLRAKTSNLRGEFEEAVSYFDEYIALKDSLIAFEKERQLMSLQVAYELDQKNAEIMRHKLALAEAEKKDLRQKDAQYALWISVFFLLALSMALYLGYMQRVKKQKLLSEKNKEVRQKKDVIEKSLKEKETLLKEIHHRVKNNLQIISSLLQLQSDKFKDDETRTAMAEAQRRIRSMAMIHQKLYQVNDVEKIPFHQYIEELAREVSGSYAKKAEEVNLSFLMEEVHYNLELAIPLGLIVNELLTNAYKYAFEGREKGSITVTIKKLTDINHEISVKDDGVGLPQDIDVEDTETLGLQLVVLLTDQIEGKLKYHCDQGTEFSIQFPVEA